MSTSGHDAKVPVRVVRVTDASGRTRISVTIGVESFLEAPEHYRHQLEKFKRAYKHLVNQALRIKKETKGARKGNALSYWRLGKLLYDFKSSTDSEFVLTNHLEAFQRDLGITDSQVGILVDFARFFKQDEVDPSVPMSYYWELLLKARRLQSIGKLSEAKQELVELVSRKEVADHKSYRKRLNELLKN
jgi:hypothetical protein